MRAGLGGRHLARPCGSRAAVILTGAPPHNKRYRTVRSSAHTPGSVSSKWSPRVGGPATTGLPGENAGAPGSLPGRYALQVVREAEASPQRGISTPVPIARGPAAGAAASV